MSADKNYESHVAETGSWIAGRMIPDKDINPLDYSDILKFSNCNDIVVSQCHIRGGQEDCVDAVRGSNYTIKDCELYPTYNGFTIKGSIDGVLIQNIEYQTHGKDCDLEFGQFDNYWWLGRKPTRNITIRNVNAVDGKPLIVKVWDSEVPKIENSNVKIIKYPKFLWIFYFIVRAAQTRGWKNVAKPVDGNTFIKTK